MEELPEKQQPSHKEGIQDPSKLEDYKCSICYDICIRPVECKGTCKKIFCMKCVSNWRLQNDECPTRCSSPFLTKDIPNFQIDFFCPYEQKQCKIIIKSVKEFGKHYKVCKSISSEDFQLETYREEYRCPKGHKLQFFIGSYEQMCKANCKACAQQKLGRSFCRICDDMFCVDCRKPNCSKKCCPVGHQYKYWNCSTLGYICDICGVSVTLSGEGVHDDQNCNFGICDFCYAELPDQITEKNVIENKEEECDKAHPLSYIDPEEKKQCDLCKKQKYCPKFCKQCGKHYCLKCKLVMIDNPRRCKYGHHFEKEGVVVNPPNAICQLCETQPCAWQDKSCHIKLCTTCLEYFMSIHADKQRFVANVVCLMKHPLRYFSGEEQHQMPCTVCNKLRAIRLFCVYCKQNNLFCFNCRKPPQNACYVGHPLNLSPGVKACQMCSEQREDLLVCDLCYFRICQQCQKGLGEDGL